MHFFIFPEKDTWLTEMSSSQNYGGDEILELSKNVTTAGETTALNGVSRVLLHFDLTELHLKLILLQCYIHQQQR